MTRQLALILVLAPPLANAASFNCKLARTAQEKAICASPTLSSADDRMALAYRDLLGAATPQMIPGIRSAQRQWIHGMVTECAASEPESLESCLLQYENDRTGALRQMVLTEDGVTFVWRSISFKIRDSPDLEASIGKAQNPGYGTLTASWPQARSSASDWTAWNRAIENVTQSLAARHDTKPSEPWSREWARDVDSDVSVSIDVVTHQLVAASVEDTWYSHGAAHPNIADLQFNWLLKEKRELQPADVFREDSGWAKFLEDFCDRDLHSQLDPEEGNDYHVWGNGDTVARALHDTVVAPSSWQLDPSGLTIIFADYSVAPHAMHPEPITVPWSDLKPMLNPLFEIPFATGPQP